MLCHSSVGIQIKSSNAALYEKAGSILDEADSILVQAQTVADKPKFGKGKKSKKGDGGIFGEFIAGVFLIGFCIPMVWMNERR